MLSHEAANAWEQGKFDNELSQLKFLSEGEPIIIQKDEEYSNVKMDKLPKLRAVFSKEGTVTAANASTLNDGASALILMSKEKAEKLGIQPIAKILSYADAAQEPELFTTSPSVAIPKA